MIFGLLSSDRKPLVVDGGPDVANVHSVRVHVHCEETDGLFRTLYLEK
jgi:hypothetical protein